MNAEPTTARTNRIHPSDAIYRVRKESWVGNRSNDQLCFCLALESLLALCCGLRQTYMCKRQTTTNTTLDYTDCRTPKNERGMQPKEIQSPAGTLRVFGGLGYRYSPRACTLHGCQSPGKRHRAHLYAVDTYVTPSSTLKKYISTHRM